MKAIDATCANCGTPIQVPDGYDGTELCPDCGSQKLTAITDLVLAYKPQPKTKAAKRRIRKKKRDAAKSQG